MSLKYLHVVLASPAALRRSVRACARKGVGCDPGREGLTRTVPASAAPFRVLAATAFVFAIVTCTNTTTATWRATTGAKRTSEASGS